METTSDTKPNMSMEIQKASAELERPLRIEDVLEQVGLIQQIMTTGGAANALDRKEQGHAISLADQVNTPEMWPSPRASDYKGSGPRGSKSQKHMEDRQYLCATAATAESGSLNPDWVEWLMGYPETWTEV